MCSRFRTPTQKSRLQACDRASSVCPVGGTMTVPRYLPPCLPVPLANPGQSNPLARYLTKWHPSPSAKTPPTSPSESSLSINQDFNPALFAAKLNNPRSLRTPLRKSSLTPVIRLFPYCRFYFSFFFLSYLFDFLRHQGIFKKYLPRN